LCFLVSPKNCRHFYFWILMSQIMNISNIDFFNFQFKFSEESILKWPKAVA
jgi:hypothetical protein